MMLRKASSNSMATFDDHARYCAYHDGTWLALPFCPSRSAVPLVTRMDYWQQHAGIDVTELFPADVTKRQASKIATFTYDTFLVACKRLAAAGHMFGNPISGCGDANLWLWALLLSFGATAGDCHGRHCHRIRCHPGSASSLWSN